MKKFLNEGNQIRNFISSSGSGTIINYGSGSDFLTSYGSGSTSKKFTVPTIPVPVPQYYVLKTGFKKILKNNEILADKINGLYQTVIPF
jgi:hypothetical protein